MSGRKLAKAQAQATVPLKALLKALSQVRPVRISSPRSPGLLCEMALFDLHLGKLCWAPEVGEDYDTRLAMRVYRQALAGLVSQARRWPVARYLFPIGNDFYNVDNGLGTTTAGTRQDEDGRWKKSFVAGVGLVAEAVATLARLAPVDVLVCAGNHDSERAFYMGEVIRATFRASRGVNVDNSPTVRKYYTWGQCLIGFTHGDKEKARDLPLIMATEQPRAWGRSKFREMHLGHFHHRRDIAFQPVAEQSGVRVRMIPSLAPADAWHKGQGYAGLRSSEAYLWHKSQGCVATLAWQA